jgi:hypothetical protein
MRYSFSAVLVFGLFLILQGCQEDKKKIDNTSLLDTALKNDSSTEEPSEPARPETLGIGSLITAAIADLSQRIGVSSADIEIMTEKSVTWPDGSMGCPKEGMMYTQALVEGTLIVLRVDGKNYQYHSGKDRPPFYCENPEKPAAKPGVD